MVLVWYRSPSLVEVLCNRTLPRVQGFIEASEVSEIELAGVSRPTKVYVIIAARTRKYIVNVKTIRR